MLHVQFLIKCSFTFCGPGSSVDIATVYGLDGPGIDSRWGRDVPHLSRLTLGPNLPPVQLVPGLSRGKERPGRDADFSPPSSAVAMKEKSYISAPLLGRTACKTQCLYKGALFLLFPSKRSMWSCGLRRGFVASCLLV
jgi:hypothetical protein